MPTELKPGWLDRQMKEVRDDVATWPEWMRRAGGFMDERRSEITPEQREAALTYARFCMRSEVHPTFMERELSRTALDLHAQNVRLREALNNLLRQASHVDEWLSGLHCACPHFGDTMDVAQYVLMQSLAGSPATEVTSEDSSKVQP